ncbi:MAG: acetate kinase [Bacilli bacterium]|nr:acetate kinase [Bacilli bacterium]
MKILSINAGSSSLKFTLFNFPEKEEVMSGNFEKIGVGNSFYKIKVNGGKIEKDVEMKDHSEAVKILMDELLANKVIDSLEDIDGIGHRIVQGADRYNKSVIIDEKVISDIDDLSSLAPLHNPAHIVGIKAFKEVLPNVPMVAVFDTAYHQTIEEENFLYPVPYEWYEKYNVRKYGAHGTSHRFVNLEISRQLGRDDLKVISCHIGNGSSITAIDSGRVIDTSMGFTPLAGVMMGSRCGDIDVSLIPYVMKKENKDIDEILNDLNKKSGLLGVSGISSDSRDVENAANEGHERSILAQNIYAQKIANYIAMYNNMLGGADVITMTAGLGERAIAMRKMIIERIASLGVVIDEEANNIRAEYRLITKPESKIPVYIVPTNEELMIAEDTYELVK